MAKSQVVQRADSTKKDKPAPMPMSQAIRQAGEGGITKQEFNQIAGDKSASSVIQKLDQINKNIRQNDGVGINLNSGAANMLIRQAGKEYQSLTSMDPLMSKLGGGSMFGTGRIGSVLQARALGTDLLGRPGNTMLGGTTIRPGGGEANRGFGQQYTLPQPEKQVIKNPIGGVGYVPSTTGGDTTTTTTVPKEEVPTVAETTPTAIDINLQDPFAVSGMATSWRRAGRGKGKGIRSTSAASRSARSMPSSKTLGM